MKRRGLWIIMSLLLITPVFAQEDATANLGDLLIRFCNDTSQEGGTKELQINTTPGSGTDICIYLVNGGETTLDVELGFVDGTVTNDAEQNKACQPDSTITQFGQYVQTVEKTFSLEPKSTIETHATVTFPEDTAGMVYGCATLKIVGDSDSDGAIQVVSRRANFIDVSVKGILRPSLQIVNQQLPVGRIVHNQDPRLYIVSKPDTKELFGKLTLKNDGNVAQYVSVQPTTKRRGAGKSYETVSKKILPGQESEFLMPITDQPFWNGPLKFDVSITSNPVLEEGSDLADQKIDSTPKQETVTTNTLFMPWMLLFGLLGLLLLGLIASGGKKKNHKHKEEKKHKTHADEDDEEIIAIKRPRRKREK